MAATVRIALIGDVHLLWDERDVRVLDARGYDLVLFVGDLAGYRLEPGRRVARLIAALRTQALVLPGNHDGVTSPQLISEVFNHPQCLRDMLARGMAERVNVLERALGPVPLCGYSLHRFQRLGLTVLAARPHSMGGPRLGFRRYLDERFGVRTMAQSSALLKSLLDQISSDERVLVLAHCGPSGLGDRRTDIFGCDFRAEQGDWGDPDLADALFYARQTGKRVVGVAAGHMHHRLRGGGQRRSQYEQHGVRIVNAARVPRQRSSNRGDERHHVRLVLNGDELSADEIWEPLSIT